MKLTLEEFKNLCADLGFGLTLPEPDQERLHGELAKKLGWNKGNGADGVLAAYWEAWEARYKSKPDRTGRDAGIAKRLVQDLGVDIACDRVRAYLEMNDMGFVARRHPLSLLPLNLGTVKLFAEGRGAVTQQELRDMDRRQANANAFAGMLERSRRG